MTDRKHTAFGVEDLRFCVRFLRSRVGEAARASYGRRS